MAPSQGATQSLRVDWVQTSSFAMFLFYRIAITDRFQYLNYDDFKLFDDNSPNSIPILFSKIHNSQLRTVRKE